VRPLIAGFALCALVAAGPAMGQWDDETLQRAFVQGMRQLESGNTAEAERILRELHQRAPTPRIKLELARALYAEGKLDEAKTYFRQVSENTDTPWRVRDNVERFVTAIEERTGYLKWAVTVVSDSNPKNQARQKEFAIGDFRVTPTESPKQMLGMKYSAQGWKPLSFVTGGYFTASYADFPGREIDRFTLDGGVVQNLVESGRVRAKTGLEFSAFADKRLYQYPYVGMDAVLVQDPAYRVTGEVKVGKVHFPDYSYLNANTSSAALSGTYNFSSSLAASLRTAVEDSHAAEAPYSYRGGDVGPGVNLFFPESAFLVGMNGSVGSRKYAAVDPMFGQMRKDSRSRLELRVGNKDWRWRSNYVSLVASVEEVRSSIEFYSYRKTNVSVLVE
jgi:hypothetical protein